MSERPARPQPESRGGGPAVDGTNHPIHRPDGGTKDSGTTAEDRSDVPTPPPTLSDEHISLIREQPTSRLPEWAAYCYRLAATEKQADREDEATKPDSIPEPYADRIQYMKKRYLRGMAAHSLALLGDGVTGFRLHDGNDDDDSDDGTELEGVDLLAKLYEWVERRHRGKRIDKDVPAHASVARKKIQSGDAEAKTYLYWQYRTDGKSTSQYICTLSSTPLDSDDLRRIFSDR